MRLKSLNVIEFFQAAFVKTEVKISMRDEACNEFVVLLTFPEIDGIFYPIITN